MKVNERQEITFFVDLDGNEVYVGDQVAAAANNSGGLRIGEVLKITGVYHDGIGYRRIRVKVRVTKTSGGVSYGPKPYNMTYDGDSVVKLRA